MKTKKIMEREIVMKLSELSPETLKDMKLIIFVLDMFLPERAKEIIEFFKSLAKQDLEKREQERLK